MSEEPEEVRGKLLLASAEMIAGLLAENQRLREELDALKPGLPIKGTVRDGKIQWTGVDSPDKTG